MVKRTKQRLQHKTDFYSNNLINSLMSVSFNASKVNRNSVMCQSTKG